MPDPITFESYDIIIGAPRWLIPTAIVSLILIVLVVWNYAASRRDAATMLAAGIKIAAILLIAVCMLQPMRRGKRPRPGANLMPIVVDTSQSMNIAAGDETPWRQQLDEIMTQTDGFLTRLSQTFDVRIYGFDSRLRNAPQFDQLARDGSESRMTKALTELAERLQERPVAGLLLMSDGNEVSSASSSFDYSKLGIPVYPVVPDEPRPIQDLRIAKIQLRESNFETAPITVTAQVAAEQMKGKSAIAQLIDKRSGNVVEEQTFSLPDDDDTTPITFRFRPEQSGVGFYDVQVFTDKDRDSFRQQDQSLRDANSSLETSLINNRRQVCIQRDAGPYRVLYFAGRANWEFKFLRRALDEDAEVQLVGLLRIARKEAKFTFRDREVTGTNPLFQGLGEGEEEAEQYDEPVIIRLGVEDADELSRGFPNSSEELFSYDAIILDDIEASYFTQDQMLMIRQFVASRGGGLLLLGGQESFAGKRFADSPLGDLSPFYPASRFPDQTQSEDREFSFALSREGRLQPWMRLRKKESDEQKRLNSMPTFKSVNPTGNLKPGAISLATIQNKTEQEKRIALASQRFGKGRAAAMPVADMWRWAMYRQSVNDQNESSSDPEQSWRQLVRWLVSEVPRTVHLKVKNDSSDSSIVTIRVDVHDKNYLPLDNAKVELVVRPPSGESLTLTARPSGDDAGVYSADYWPRESGGYVVESTAMGPDGVELGTDQAGWVTQVGASEFDSLRVNRSKLEKIADESGGKIILQSELDSLIDDLPTDRIPVTETWVYPIWHQPWMMGLAIVLLCSEWGLRRWRGLA